MPPYNEQGYQKIDNIENGEEKIKKLKKKVQFEDYDEPSEKPKEKWSTRMKLVAFVTFMVHFIVFGAIALIMPYFPIVVSVDLSNHNCVFAFACFIKLYILSSSPLPAGHAGVNSLLASLPACVTWH